MLNNALKIKFIIFNEVNATEPLSDIKLLKTHTKKLLEQYGYFASESIWNFVSNEKETMPIYLLSGMEEKDLGDRLNAVKEQAIRANNLFS